MALSTLFAFIRGFTRELIALLAWIFGVVAGIAFSPAVAKWLPEFRRRRGGPLHPGLRAHPARGAAPGRACCMAASQRDPQVRAGFVDRFLGAIFGVARGVLLVMGFVIVAGLTSLPRQDWWQNAALAPALAAAAAAAAPWLPEAWAQRLDYSREGRTLPKSRNRTHRRRKGETTQCVASSAW
jgi:membrane protein required for colicin V production